MRPALIIGNWKMNGCKQSIECLLSDLINESASNFPELVLCSPFIYLQWVREFLVERGSLVKLGAQNVSEYTDGAYTGEVSATMLSDVGCQYVLVGHSERRKLFKEIDQQVFLKARRLIEAAIVPVVCVGETRDERDKGLTEVVLARQLEPFFARGQDGLLSGCVIAYEPVWAIGTGCSARPEQAQNTHSFIRQYLVANLGQGASDVRIVYGGSVRPDNADSLFAMPDIDGALVGGASLNGQEFLSIAKASLSYNA